jgi:hypothetical protein
MDLAQVRWLVCIPEPLLEMCRPSSLLLPATDPSTSPFQFRTQEAALSSTARMTCEITLAKCTWRTTCCQCCKWRR